MIFHYSFRDESGLVKKGRITADSEELASRRLEMMSIKPTNLWKDGEVEPSNLNDASVEPTPPDTFFKEQDELFKQYEQANKDQPPTSFKPVLSQGNESVSLPPKPPLPSRLPREFAAPLPSKKQIEKIYGRRKQELLFGEYTELSTLINYHLSKNGNVLHLCMQPDIKGKLQIAIVIEYDQQEEGTAV